MKKDARFLKVFGGLPIERIECSLRLLCIDLFIDQSELADLVGVSRQYMNKIINQKRNMTIAMALAVVCVAASKNANLFLTKVFAKDTDIETLKYVNVYIEDNYRKEDSVTLYSSVRKILNYRG